jgi:hypothetical protein
MLSGGQSASAASHSIIGTLPSEFLAVHLGMLPSGMVLMLRGLQVMAECDPGMMRGLLMIARFVKLRGLTMMFGSLVIVLRCLFVMLVYLVFRHSVLPDISWLSDAPGIQTQERRT